MEQEFARREPHDDRIAQRVQTRKIVLAVVGAVIGTISLCGLMSPVWGVLGWTFSVLSLVRILSVPHPAAGRERPRASIGVRVALASLAVFCLLFMTAMLTAFNADPQAIGNLEIAIAIVLSVVGTLSAGIVLRMTSG